MVLTETARMRVIAKGALREFWTNHADARQPLEAWYHEALKAHWKTPQDVKNHYANASFVAGNRIIFNIGGNKYRLVVRVNYEYGIVYIRFIGTHAEYDRIDVERI